MPFTTKPNLSIASQWMAPMWSAPKPHCHYMQNHRVNFCQHHLLADLSRLRSITLPSDPSDSWQGQPPKCGHLELPGDAIAQESHIKNSWHILAQQSAWRIWLYPHKRTLWLAEIRKCCSCMFMHVHACSCMAKSSLFPRLWLKNRSSESPSPVYPAGLDKEFILSLQE